MIFDRRRVDDDLERIRRANLPEKVEKEDEEKRVVVPEEKIGAKDVLAMIIAVFSIVIPYVLVFVAALGAVMLLFFWFL